MPDIVAPFMKTCPMQPDQAARAFQMIASHPEFSGIKAIINHDGETVQPAPAQLVPEGQIMVTFEIPREGVSMPDFFRELCNALQPQEPMITVQREKEG